MNGSRKYSGSSSFKMAVLFAILLTISSSVLVYFMYSYSKGRYISESEVVIDSSTYELILILGILSIFFMSLVVIISFLISNFVVNRINTIGTTAERIIKTGNLSRRISMDKKWDDLSNLAAILNNLFARIESSMEDVRRVSDSIAHDLKTPLTRIKNNIEDAKAKGSIEKDLSSKLLKEADKLLDTFNALLRITNIEKGKRYSEFKNINLKKIIVDVIELYEPITDKKKIKISSDLENINFDCDKDLIFQAIANIFDNAVKFTPENGKIDIRLKNIDDLITLEISDSGEGIELEEKEKIFNRFYRGDKGRTTSGSGLGLSLVLAVVKMHGGIINVMENKPSGSKFIIKFEIIKNI